MDRRIVITGVGVISSIGIGKQEFWSNVLEGKSGISEVSSFDTSHLPVHRGGEIKNFNSQTNLGRNSSLTLSAAKLALQDAHLEPDRLNRQRTGVCIGTTMGESQIIQQLNEAWINKGVDALDIDLIPRCPANVLSINLAAELKLSGSNFVIPNACAAGNFAIGYAYDLLRLGKAEMMLAGGGDAFSRIAFVGFSRMFAIAPQMCQPFDKNRKGMMVGEGAGILVLETLESALKRNASIYAEVLGYGLSCDARHMTAPFSEGIKEAIENALRQSKIEPSQVDYISAHGTGTAINDKEECLAIKKVFKESYKRIPISSIKSMIGHTMGAASSIEAIVCCLAIKHAVIPPTINYETPDPECDIDCVPNTARSHKVNIALNNASAFGGNNSCLVLKKYPA